MNLPFTYGSVCSGMEAASLAWSLLGWRCAFVSEIEKAPCALLKQRFPDVPNFGDMTKFEDWPDVAIDLLAGGTPCQAFSVAGLRKGLADPRGSLMLTYGAIAKRYRPTWLFWENVPGVLSSDEGRDFGAFLGMLAELGYGFAYRVLDAQFFDLAQRRARVFVVGYLGDWRPPAAVLFEPESLRGDSPPSREAREGIAGTIAGGARRSGGYSHDDVPLAPEIPSVARPLCASDGGIDREDRHTLIAALDCYNQTASVEVVGIVREQHGTNMTAVAYNITPIQSVHRGDGKQNGAGIGAAGEPMFTVTGCDQHAIAFDTTQITSPTNRSQPHEGEPCHPITAEGHAPAVAFSCKDHGADASELAPTLRAMGHDGSHANAGGQVAVVFMSNESFDSGENVDIAPSLRVASNGGGQPPAIAFALRGREGGALPEIEGEGDKAGALRAADGGSSRDYVAAFDARQSDVIQYGDMSGPLDTDQQSIGVLTQYAVRRLTPRECERLQGAPDDHTLVTYRGKPMADGPRYKMIGNSWAVPCVRWIGERIDLVRSLPPSPNLKEENHA